MNIKKTTSKCVCKKIISTNKNKNEVGPSHMKVHPTRLSHHWRPNFGFENYYVPPSFAFLEVNSSQTTWMDQTMASTKKKKKKKNQIVFCQNGCLCQKFDYFAKNDEYGQEVM